MVIEKDEWWALSLSTLSLVSFQYPDGFSQIIPSFWKEKKIQSRTGVKISLVPHLFKQVKTRAQYKEPSGETGWLHKKLFLD